MGKKKVEFEPVVMYDEDRYVSITLNEYKELLITKGKYEELKERESTLKYPIVTFSNVERNKNGDLKDLDKNIISY